MKSVLETTFGTLYRYVDKLMGFMFSIALRTESNEGFFRTVNDAVGHATIGTLGCRRVIVTIVCMLSIAVQAISVDHDQQ